MLDEEEQEWLSIVSQSRVRNALRRMAREAKQETMTDKTIKIRIRYDGGPAHTAKITDAETGATIEGAFRLELDARNGIPIATLYTYQPVIDVTTDAKVLALCPGCQKLLNQDQEPHDESWEGA